MPTIEAKESHDHPVLIVSGGPSLGLLDWQHVQRQISKKHRGPCKVVLVNGVANGRRPTFAAGDMPTVLKQWQSSGLHERSTIILNAPHRVAVDTSLARDLGILLASKKTLFAPDRWPLLPAEPLAVWAMSALGFRWIYLFGIDGSRAWSKRTEFQHWKAREDLIRLNHKARFDSPFAAESPEERPKLVRVWPLKLVVKREPLEGAIHDTLRVAPPSSRKEKA